MLMRCMTGSRKGGRRREQIEEMLRWAMSINYGSTIPDREGNHLISIMSWENLGNTLSPRKSNMSCPLANAACGKIKKKFLEIVRRSQTGLTRMPQLLLWGIFHLSLPVVVTFWFIICCFLRTLEKKRNFSELPTDEGNEKGKLFTFEGTFVLIFWLATYHACKSQKLHMKRWKKRFLKIFSHYFYSCRVLFIKADQVWMSRLVDCIFES